MPELPEVETIRRCLLFNIGARLEKLELRRDDIVRELSYDVESLVGSTLEDIQRRGKYIILVFNRHSLVIHLGMSGRFYAAADEEDNEEKHRHLILFLDNGYRLVYVDPRRFGGVWFTDDAPRVLARLGPEPFDPRFGPDYLYKMTRHRKVAIKTLLLNQSIVAGLGNIYVDEALFAAGIMPGRPADSLRKAECSKLSKSIVDVLQAGIENCGTTFRDYRDGFNREGQFQNMIKVYGRSGEMCVACSTPLVRSTLGGRSTHHCPHCQK